MTTEDTVVDFHEALRPDELFDAPFSLRPETSKAGITAEYQGYDVVEPGPHETSRVTGPRTDEGKRGEHDTCLRGILEPVGDDPEWAFDQFRGSSPQGN